VRSRFTTAVWCGVALIWVGLLAAGAVWIRRHPATKPAASSAPASGCLDASSKKGLPGFVSKRTLEVNHRIGEADASWSAPAHGARKDDLLGRYSACAVRAGDPIAVDEVRLLPALTYSAGRVPYALSLAHDDRLVDVLNAGSVLEVREGERPLARGVKVLAVQCGPGMPPPAGSCDAILDALPDEAARLASANAAAIKVTIAAPKP